MTIIPDLYRLDTAETILDRENNGCTVIHQWMSRYGGNSVEVTHVTTQQYQQWLAEECTPGALQPHITFGGCIEPGTGDPTFLARWTDYALRTFALVPDKEK